MAEITLGVLAIWEARLENYFEKTKLLAFKNL